MSSNNFRKFGGRNRMKQSEMLRNDVIQTNQLTVNGKDGGEILPSVRISSSPSDASQNNIVLDQGDTPYSYAMKVQSSYTESISQLRYREYNSITKEVGRPIMDMYYGGGLKLFSDDSFQCGIYINDKNNPGTQYGFIGQTDEDNNLADLQFFNNYDDRGTRINFRATGDQQNTQGDDVLNSAIFHNAHQNNDGKPSLNLFALNDLGVGDDDNGYNLVLRKLGETQDASASVGMKFVSDTSGASSIDRRGTGAIMLEPSGSSYALNFYVKTGGEVTASDRIFGIQNESLMRVYTDLRVEDGHKIVLYNTDGSSIDLTYDTLVNAVDGNYLSLSGGIITGDLTIDGCLNVTGTEYVIHREDLVVQDKDIILGDVSNGNPSDITADGGGIILTAGTDGSKNLLWELGHNAWTSNVNMNLESGNSYKINGADILTTTALGSSVVDSSLTSVGTLTGLTVDGGSDISFGGSKITNVGKPSSSELTAAATVGYVHDHVVSVSGDYLKVDGTNSMQGNLNMSGNKITSLASPTIATDAVNSGYLTTQLGQLETQVGLNYLKLDGTNSMNGDLNMNNNSIKNIAKPNETDLSYAATVEYVHDHVVSVSGDYLKVDGSNKMEGHLDMSGHSIKNIAKPSETDLSYAATVEYVHEHAISVSGDYLKVDGTNSMEGNLDISNNNLTNVDILSTNTLLPHSNYVRLSPENGSRAIYLRSSSNVLYFLPFETSTLANDCFFSLNYNNGHTRTTFKQDVYFNRLLGSGTTDKVVTDSIEIGDVVGPNWKLQKVVLTDTRLYFYYGNLKQGYILNTGTTNDVRMNFTGQHHNYSTTEIIDELYKGLIVSSTGTYRNSYVVGTTKSEDDITINESLPIVEISQIAQDKKCFGVVSDKDDTTDTVEQASGVFVSVFHVKNEDRRLTINSLGEGAIWVCDVNGAIENGDYITTSVIPGIGMRQDDDLLHNYTVAKITMDCAFAPDQIHQNKIRLDTSGNPIWNSTTNQYDFDMWYDENGDPVIKPEYTMKFIQIHENDYTLYNDEHHTDEYLTVDYDFRTHSPDMIGNTYKAAFVGCTYHCG